MIACVLVTMQETTWSGEDGRVLTNAIAEPDDRAELVPHGELRVPGSEARAPSPGFPGGPAGHGGGGDLDDPGAIGGEAGAPPPPVGAAVAAVGRRADPAGGADPRGEADGAVGVGGCVAAAVRRQVMAPQLHESLSLLPSLPPSLSRLREDES